MVHPTPIWLKKFEWKKGQNASPATQFKTGQLPHNTGHKERQIKVNCLNCGKEFIRYMNREKKPVFCSAQCMYDWQRGSNHPFWKGGFKNTEAYKSRKENKTEYCKWRIKVLAKDDCICQKCRKENSFNAHHIKSWKEYPELRFDVKNGECLCLGCHNKTKKFGK